MPDMFLMAKGSAAAACLAAVIFLLFSWPWRIVSPKLRTLGSVLGAGTGFFVGWWILGVRPNWPPLEDTDRFLLILLPAIVVVELASTLLDRSPRRLRLLRFLVGSGLTPLLLHKTIYLVDIGTAGTRLWPPPKAAIILSLLALAIIAGWTSLIFLARRSESASVPLSVSFACLGTGLAIMLSGYASGGQLGLPLATAVGGVAVASWLLARPVDLTGLLGFAVIGHTAVLLSGFFFADLTLTNALLLVLGPQFGWIAELPGIRRPHAAIRAALRLIPAIILTVVALFLAQQKFVENSAAPSADPTLPSIDDYSNFGK